MAHRPVFIPDPQGGLVEERTIEFDWFPGFSVRQKQRSIESLHRSAGPRLSPLLEVSTKSPSPFGRQLSAFNLRVPSDERRDPILLEAAFQGSKVFKGAGGPFRHLYSSRSGREVKRYMSQYADDQLKEFCWDGESWPLEPKTAFYDWLYIRALRTPGRRDEAIDEKLRGYRAFTDIEFNPARSMNCQARSCALYVALLQRCDDLDEAVADKNRFLSRLDENGYGAAPPPLASGQEQGVLLL